METGGEPGAAAEGTKEGGEEPTDSGKVGRGLVAEGLDRMKQRSPCGSLALVTL